MTHATRLKPQPWMTASETQKLMTALEDSGITARFVGGCVRDALLGRPVFDIDIAVDASPLDVIEALEKRFIKCVPTGIEHGTITAALNHKAFQITSLRADVETDGRHAVVDFIKDWKQDASRRDLTMNALYADKDGYIYDPCGTGLEDLQNGIVHFIGNPYKRIEEDALRVLRFFRFSAHYSTKPLDPVSLKACIAFVDKLSTLSAERISYEFWRLCSAYKIHPILSEMQKAGILKTLFPFGGDFVKGLRGIKALHDIEESANTQASPFARMAALFQGEDASKLPERLKFSRKDTKYFLALNDHVSASPDKPSSFLIKKMLYLRGPYFTQDFILLNATLRHLSKNEPLNDLTLEVKPLLEKARDWQHPQFPIKGEDIIREGLTPGPDVSRYLDKIQDWWIEQDFLPKREECLGYFRELV